MTIYELHAVVTIYLNFFLLKLNLNSLATYVKQVAIRFADTRFKAWELSEQCVKFLSRNVSNGDELSGDYVQKRLFIEVVERVELQFWSGIPLTLKEELLIVHAVKLGVQICGIVVT